MRAVLFPLIHPHHFSIVEDLQFRPLTNYAVSFPGDAIELLSETMRVDGDILDRRCESQLRLICLLHK